MHRALERLEHRPWPLPQRPWVWRQSWVDLLFAHWEVPVAALRERVPEQLDIDTFEGKTYIALVPFRMTGVMRRPFPDMPYVSAFPEVNVRVYVSYDGVPGVWFFSLDAPNPLAVWAAQNWFHLPYEKSHIDFAETDGVISYRSKRAGKHPGTVPALSLEYQATGAPYEAEAGTLEHWLTERYCLYARSARGTLFRCEVHHWPWPLQRATANIEHNTMFTPHGVDVSGPPQLLHFSRSIDVVMWPPERVSSA